VLNLQRQQQIVSFLAQQGAGTIAELSEKFGVSQMTIRRDLVRLEQERVIQRTHGGAIYVESTNGERTFAVKASLGQAVKDKIAECAVRTFVHDGDVIILEGGTTVASMARFLTEFRSLTVLTNGLQTASNLANLHPSSTVMVCGGMLRAVNSTLVGPVTADFFKRFRADVAFFSAIGFTADHGFTDANLFESQAKVEMQRAAAQAVLLMDANKFGQSSLVTTFTHEVIDAVVTTDTIPDNYAQYLRTHGVEVVLTKL
jgi:DeoR/GlpR family transcriptional regulator of sugar metabolism